MTSDHPAHPASDAAGEVLLHTCGWMPDDSSAAPPPCWLRGASDRERLRRACTVLRRHGIESCSALGVGDAAGARERIRELLLARSPGAEGAFLFWTAVEDQRCFGADGNLAEPLLAHAGGAGTEIAAQATMAMVGLLAQAGHAPGTLIVTRP